MKWLVALLFLAGCEGDSAGHCEYSGRCDDGLVCAGDATCWPAESVLDLRVQWTLNGVAPSLAQPGPCDRIDYFGVGIEEGGISKSGFAASVQCTDGAGLLEGVPPEYRVLRVGAYIAGNPIETTIELPADPPADVSIDLAVP